MRCTYCKRRWKHELFFFKNNPLTGESFRFFNSGENVAWRKTRKRKTAIWWTALTSSFWNKICLVHRLLMPSDLSCLCFRNLSTNVSKFENIDGTTVSSKQTVSGERWIFKRGLFICPSKKDIFSLVEESKFAHGVPFFP
jgi:hypothetical protein